MEINLIKQMMNEAMQPYRQLMEATRGLAQKWEKTGLLEGMKGDTQRNGMAVMLENQAQRLVLEHSATGTTADAEQWQGVALPLVRKVFGEIASREFLAVQPMNLPSGLVFYLEFTYGTAVAPRTVGQSLYGDTTSSNRPSGGLYGAGRGGYSINDFTSSFTAITATAPNSSSTGFSSLVSASQVLELIVPITHLSGADATFVQAFTPSGSGFVTHYPQYTRLSFDQSQIIFVVPSGAIVPSGTLVNVGKVTYTKQPTPTSRGDFEDTVGSSIPPNGANLNIPEINISLRQVQIVAHTRRMKYTFTPELQQDLNAYHSIDAEAELTGIMSDYMSLEVDAELLEMLLNAALTVDYWSANIGVIWNGSAFVTDATLSGQAWTDMTWAQTLGRKMQAVSNRIHQLTMRGGATFAAVSPDVATIIETIPGFSAKTDGNQKDFAAGISAVGSFQNRFQIYKIPYLTSNVILMGYRGNNFLETGAVYAPYIPFIMSPLVWDPENFTPRRSLMTRYAKLVTRREFYGKIYVTGIPTV